MELTSEVHHLYIFIVWVTSGEANAFTMEVHTYPA